MANPIGLEAAPNATKAASVEAESEVVPPSDTPPPALDDTHGAIQRDHLGHQEASIEGGVLLRSGPFLFVVFYLCSPCRGRRPPVLQQWQCTCRRSDLGALLAGPRRRNVYCCCCA